MSKRTQVVCIHEGTKGASIDPVFINAFFKAYNPEWLRPWGTSKVRLVPYGGKSELRSGFAKELRNVIAAGGNTTLVVFADIDDDLEGGEDLKARYWEAAKNDGISEEEFSRAVFIFSKDRIENWIEFIMTGRTDEHKEGERVNNNALVREAAHQLAKRCLSSVQEPPLPPSLEWSCRNWHQLVRRMK